MEDKRNMIKINMEQLKNPEVGVFSKKNEGELYYLVSLKTDKDSENLTDKIVLGTCEKGNPHNIKTKCISLLHAITENNIDEFNRQARNLKNMGVQFSEEYKTIISTIIENNKKEKSSEEISEDISIERKIKMEEIFHTDEEVREETEIELKEDRIDYSELDKKFPVVSGINFEYVPDEEIIKAGKKVTKRLETLNGIITPEDAAEYEQSLVDFMKYRDIPTNTNRIISQYIDKIRELDHNTIIACLKEMENASENEDAKLYSIYLRMQENRIIERVQSFLINQKSREEFPDGKIEELLQVLEDRKIDIPSQGGEVALQQVILENMHNEADDLDYYVKHGRKLDFELVRYVKAVEPQTKEEENEQIEIEKYLKCKIASLGQVTETKDKSLELRNFIEETNFVSKDEDEKNRFLKEVSKVETKYLTTKYGPILDRYHELENGVNLAKYEEELKTLENKKKEAQGLFNEYNKLNEKGENEINDK